MHAAVFKLVGSSLCDAGWGEVVRSLEGAIDGRDHALLLACALGLAMVVWVNWKIARHLISRPQKRR